MGIEQFKSFAKGPDKKAEENRDVWLYTRVSSKEQELNRSLSVQASNANQCTKENNFNLTSTFGGTYESASGDFTRKEFMRLLEAVRTAKKRPYAILINTISRFSRTGGKGIALAQELIDDMGVHLFEISTGRNTFTEQGKLEIYHGLLNARQENIDRLKVTIPGMKKFLEDGKCLGKAPRGYHQYGPRVKDPKFHSPVQKIILNDEGKIMKQAWQWKLQGEQNINIIKKLENLGVQRISEQSLSQMLRNPFYCGILCHKMLEGKVVKCNWEKMVSEKDFLAVQEILKGNHQGYKQDKANPYRPLNAFILCSNCGGKMSGYEVKKKGVHYYKCQQCKGVSINAETTKRAKGVGAHDMFKDLLSLYTLPASLQELFKAQLKLTYETLNIERYQEEELLRKELNKAELDLKALKKKYMLDENSDKDVYNELKLEFETKIRNLNESLEKLGSEISNLDLYLDISIQVAQSINKYWVSDGLETKKRVQELVFPDGLLVDVKNRVYLTKEVNSVFEVTHQLSSGSEDEIKKPLSFQGPFIGLVAGAGFEPTTFGL